MPSKTKPKPKAVETEIPWEALKRNGIAEYFWLRRRLLTLQEENDRLVLRKEELYRALVLTGVAEAELRSLNVGDA